MLHALTRSFAAAATPRSSSSDFDAATPHNADELLARLAAARPAAASRRCRLTRNRNVMVSFGGGELRVHEGYLGAPEPVLRAIVTFVEGRTRAERRAAQRVIVGASDPRRRARRRGASGRIPTTSASPSSSPRGIARYNARHFHGRAAPDRRSASRAA